MYMYDHLPHAETAEDYHNIIEMLLKIVAILSSESPNTEQAT